MGPNLSFTREEVVAAAGVDPWTRQAQFQQEINPNDIAATRDTYLRAAEQATSVQDIATQATQISQGAGGNDGAPLVDGADRDQQTADGMQQGGADIAAVGETLNRAMNRAIGAHDQVLALIPPLDTTHTTNIQAAVDEYNAWVTSVQGVPLEPGTAEAMAEGIRQRWIEQTATAARTADADITAAVEAYRMDMMAQANELQYLGYEPSEGPFQLFTTPEMGQWAAAGLNAEAQKENPDQGKIDRYLDGLQSVNSGVYGPTGPGTTGPNEADRAMTPEERAYLDSFYGTVSADTLAALGNNDSLGGAATTVANGIDTLMNPELGGIDTAVSPEQVPASIGEYLNGYGDQIAGQASVDRFNGFGSLMESATVAPGDDFAANLATAGLEVQEAVDAANIASAGSEWNPESTSMMPPLALTGSGDLLSHVSTNAAASTDILMGSDARNRMLAADWQDSQGIADLINSSTRPAEDGSMTPDQEYVADEVLGFYADNPDELIHDWETDDAALPEYDNVPLQGAVAEAALNRMDALVGYGDARPSDDVYGVFGLMGATDPTVNEYFKTGIGAEQHDLAYDVYAGNVDAAARQGVLEDIGDLTQYVNWGEADALQHYAGDEDKQDKLSQDQAIASVGAAAAIGGLMGGPAGAAAGAVAGAGWSMATPAFSEYEAQAPKDLADYQAGEVPLNNQLMEYALLSGAADAYNANGVADITLPDVAPDPTVSESLAAAHGLNDDANSLLGQLSAQDESIRADVGAVQAGSRNIAPFTEHHPFAAERRAEAAEENGG
ncbi:hypothetical protein [Streptomyces sp. B6B3]|uniref:hypothetical protein n=1 Tax=Streptomyces sp. B6B3 TaxID=3153570 RepID=UPI00325D8EFF